MKKIYTYDELILFYVRLKVGWLEDCHEQQLNGKPPYTFDEYLNRNWYQEKPDTDEARKFDQLGSYGLLDYVPVEYIEAADRDEEEWY